MKMKAMLSILENIGWVVRKDEVGDYWATFMLSDRIVFLLPTIRDLGENKKLSAMLSVSTSSFIEAYSFILGQKEGYTPLIRAVKGPKYSALSISEVHVHQLSEEAIKWSQEQSIENALVEYSSLPTSAKGALPIRHLAALALLHNTEKLKAYQISFMSGDQLNFVPYITKDIIDRSVILAMKNLDS